jgi:hypothetical protein
MKWNFIIILFFLFSCSSGNTKENPNTLIDKNTFIKVLQEVHLSESEFHLTKYNRKETAEKLLLSDYETIFSENNITKEDFDNTLKYYSNHPDELEVIYEEVLEGLLLIQLESD